MTSEDWNALFAEMPEETKERLAFINLGAGTDHRAHRPKSRLTKRSDEQSSGKEGIKEKQGSYDRERPRLTPVSGKK